MKSKCSLNWCKFLCSVLILELKAAPKSGAVEQLTTPLRTANPFDENHDTNRPKALVSPMVKQVEMTSSGWKKLRCSLRNLLSMEAHFSFGINIDNSDFLSHNYEIVRWLH